VKIALVVPGGVDRSGEYRVIPALLSLMQRLARSHELQVFALAQEERPDSWDLAGARVHNIGRGHTRWHALRSILAEHRRAPFDVAQSIWSGRSGFIAVAAARALRIPGLVHVAGGEVVALPEIGYGGRLSLRNRLREAVVLRAANQVTAATPAMIAALARCGIAATRLPLGADLTVWPARAPRRRDPKGPARLVHVGSINRVKDQATLLRALAALAASGTRFEMDLVGEDTLGGELQALAGALGLGERVRFRGFLTQTQLRPLVQAAHLMVISSRHEAGPLAVLEAAAVGVPTVGTAVGHVAEWAPTASLAVPVGDHRALAHALGELLGDEERRLRLAREAAARAVREDADHTARAFQAMYATLGPRRA
jgi:glycosyltransferase involved in cell wall biosynthesis